MALCLELAPKYCLFFLCKCSKTQFKLFIFGIFAEFSFLFSLRLQFPATFSAFNLILDMVQKVFLKKRPTYLDSLYLVLLTFEIYANYVPLFSHFLWLRGQESYFSLGTDMTPAAKALRSSQPWP